MPDYAALKAEIALPAYAGLSDQAIVDTLNAPVAVTVDVPIGSVVGYLAVAGKLAGIIGYSGNDQNTAVACRSLATIVQSPQLSTFQCSDPTTYQAIAKFIGAFQASGLISAADQTALLAMAHTTSSRAKQLGFGQVRLAQIAAVRAGAATAATMARVIYSVATRQPRRVIVPSTDSDLAAHIAGTGEAELDVPLASFSASGDPASLAGLVASATGLPVLIAVIVNNTQHVIGNVVSDPACGDVLTGAMAGQTIAIQSPAPIAVGWLWDGGIGFKPPG